MKIQKIFYVLALGLLIFSLSGATGVMAQGTDNDGKTRQSCCSEGGKPVSECTPEERAACQAKCDTQAQKCDPADCPAPCDPKKGDSGI